VRGEDLEVLGHVVRLHGEPPGIDAVVSRAVVEQDHGAVRNPGNDRSANAPGDGHQPPSLPHQRVAARHEPVRPLDRTNPDEHRIRVVVNGELTLGQLVAGEPLQQRDG
jgi:hypothetical protein